MTENPFDFNIAKILAGAFARSVETADNSSVELNPFRVEELLNQSSGLLDRCVESRDRILDFEERKELFRLDFQEGKIEFELAMNEIANSFSQSETVFEIEKRLIDSLSPMLADAVESSRAAVERRESGSDERTKFVDTASELAGNSAYSNNAVVTNHASNLQEQRFDFELLDSRSTRTQVSALSNNHSARFQIENSKLDFAAHQKRIKESRAELALDRFRELARLAAEVGGPFNFHERSIHAAEILEADFSEALMRTSSASVGLKLVYGLESPLPDKDSTSILDELAVWTRTAMINLARLTQKDFRQSKIVSLSSVYGGLEALKEAMTKGELEFTFDQSTFKGKVLARVRGVDACFVSSASKLNYVSLNLSKQDSENPIARPAIRLGSVRRLSEQYEPDFRHSDQLFNFSPIGRWTIGLDQLSPEGIDVFETLDDLIVVFDVVVQDE